MRQWTVHASSEAIASGAGGRQETCTEVFLLAMRFDSATLTSRRLAAGLELSLSQGLLAENRPYLAGIDEYIRPKGEKCTRNF
jgi:hypothetical protein